MRRGTHDPTRSDKLSNSQIAFPLPPLAEQHRIVAKVDELMALCDRLEAARAEREATRDRLAAASLARLNAPDPDDLPRPTPASPSTRCPPSPRAPTRSSNSARPSSTSPCAASSCRRTQTDEPASELLKRIDCRTVERSPP